MRRLDLAATLRAAEVEPGLDALLRAVGFLPQRRRHDHGASAFQHLHHGPAGSSLDAGALGVRAGTVPPTLSSGWGFPQRVIDAGWTSLDRVTASLNRAYWGHGQATSNRIIGGSWGKQTRVHPTKDIDMLFILPISTFHRFEARSGNKQSQLLQEVRQVLAETYPRTTVRGDGQVVVVDLGHVTIEVVPTFSDETGSLWICDTNNGGAYKRCDPWAEITTLDAADVDTGGSARHLARLAKLWRRHANVPLEIVLFLNGWRWRF